MWHRFVGFSFVQQELHKLVIIEVVVRMTPAGKQGSYPNLTIAEVRTETLAA